MSNYEHDKTVRMADVTAASSLDSLSLLFIYVHHYELVQIRPASVKNEEA